MTDKEIQKMILELIEIVDYDIYKSFLPEYSELTKEDINQQLEELVNVVKKHIK